MVEIMDNAWLRAKTDELDTTKQIKPVHLRHEGSMVSYCGRQLGKGFGSNALYTVFRDAATCKQCRSRRGGQRCRIRC